MTRLFKKLSASEWIMIVLVALLVICIITRWEYVWGEVATAFRGLMGK